MQLAVVELTVDQYLDALQRQTNREKRGRMKSIAFAAMYSGRPDAKILMPAGLMPEGEEK